MYNVGLIVVILMGTMTRCIFLQEILRYCAVIVTLSILMVSKASTTTLNQRTFSIVK